MSQGNTTDISSTAWLNITEGASIPCNLTENPWCGQFGAQQVIEVVFLVTISVVGTFGNLLVIASITYMGQQYKNGNLFFINLAIADLLVTGICFPTYVANVFRGGNALPDGSCKFVGYLMTVSIACSLTNMACIAVSRYWAIVRYTSYAKVFCQRNMCLLVLCIWIYSNILVAPVWWDGIGIGYRSKAMICVWNLRSSAVYNCISCIFAIVVPAATMSIFYWKLYKFIRVRGKSLRKRCSQSLGNSIEKRSLKREMAVLKTLIATVVAFFLFWIPNLVNIVDIEAPVAVDKYIAWLALSNSAVNFIIYGVTNTNHRTGYVKLLTRMFFCKKDLISLPEANAKEAPGLPTNNKRPRPILTISRRQVCHEI